MSVATANGLASLIKHEAEFVRRLQTHPKLTNQTVANLAAVRDRICRVTGETPLDRACPEGRGDQPFPGCRTAVRAILSRLPEVGCLEVVTSDEFTESQLQLKMKPLDWIACSGPNLASNLQNSHPSRFPVAGVVVAVNTKNPELKKRNLITGCGLLIHELGHAMGANDHSELFILACCLIHYRVGTRVGIPLSSIGVGYGSMNGTTDDLFTAYSQMFPFFRQTASMSIREVIGQVDDGAIPLPKAFHQAASPLCH